MIAYHTEKLDDCISSDNMERLTTKFAESLLGALDALVDIIHHVLTKQQPQKPWDGVAKAAKACSSLDNSHQLYAVGPDGSVLFSTSCSPARTGEGTGNGQGDFLRAVKQSNARNVTHLVREIAVLAILAALIIWLTMASRRACLASQDQPAIPAQRNS